MIGAVIVQDNSTGGKKVKLKAVKARWRGGWEKSNDSSPYVSFCDRNDWEV